MKHFALIAMLFALTVSGCSPPVDQIKEGARKASVQTVFHVPVLKVSFTTPLPEKEVINQEKLTEAIKSLKEELEKQVKDLLEENNKLLKEDRFQSYLTDIDVYGYEPPSKTMIPIGALIKDEKEYKFPERVIVACKTEKTEIKEWEKEYEKDVLAISETANVSPTKAKEILARLRLDGYSVNKEEISQSSDVTLLWYSSGWGSVPRTLSWKVEIEGTEENIIVGYSDGVIETRPIPDKKRVHVVAGFLKIQERFREKPFEVKSLEDKVEDLKEEIKNLEKTLEEKQKEIDKKEEKKRDITEATLWDVALGAVKLEQFWYATAASGTYIGETRLRKEMGSWSAIRSWLYFQHDVMSETAAVILTNAHVAAIAAEFALYVSDDKEVMYFQYPGFPFIRYETTSDFWGSPASILSIDEQPLIAHDLDSGIMVTTPVDFMKPYTPKLGNSDRVENGDSIVMVGNPSLLQKFTTQGIVSNKGYSVIDGLMYQFASRYLVDNPILYKWLKNSNFWFDCPIGVGGTSGSGVWAISGKEAGNLIAIHNMGLNSSCSTITVDPRMKEIKPIGSGEYIKDFAKENPKKFVDRDGYKSAVYSITYDAFVKDNQEFEGLIKQTSCKTDIAGLNAGIPINLVKQYLVERGVQIETKQEVK